jgi:hypothetical protein
VSSLVSESHARVAVSSQASQSGPGIDAMRSRKSGPGFREEVGELGDGWHIRRLLLVSWKNIGESECLQDPVTELPWVVTA